MKNLTNLALETLRYHPYAAALLGFIGALSFGLAKLAAMLESIG